MELLTAVRMSVLAIIHVLQFFSLLSCFKNGQWLNHQHYFNMYTTDIYCLHDVYFRQRDGKAGFATKNFDITR